MTRSGVRRTVAGVVNSFETFEGAGLLVRRPFAKRRRDPLEEARKRIHAQRRVKHGSKLWLNLAKRDKMTKPRYQQITLE